MKDLLLSITHVGTQLQWFAAFPKRIAEAIQQGDDQQAINFARAITADYEQEGDSQVYWRTLDGHKFYNDFATIDQSLREIWQNFMLHGVYEPHTTELVKSIVKPGMHAVDIGASIGYFTLLLARMVGETGHVTSFEPTTNQFPVLSANIKKNGYSNMVTAHNVAASDTDGPVHIQCNAMNTKDVEGMRVDAFLHDPVDFIKIDTDGSDVRVLRGLQETIARSPNLKMVVEYYPKYLENLGADPKEFVHLIEKDFTYGVIDGDYGTGCWNWICTKR